MQEKCYIGERTICINLNKSQHWMQNSQGQLGINALVTVHRSKKFFIKTGHQIVITIALQQNHWDTIVYFNIVQDDTSSSYCTGSSDTFNLLLWLLNVQAEI